MLSVVRYASILLLLLLLLLRRRLRLLRRRLLLRTVMRMVPSICTLGATSMAEVMKPSSGTHAMACALVGTSKGLIALCSTRLAITKGEVRTCRRGEERERRWACGWTRWVVQVV